MTAHRIVGDVDSALGHLAALGLAAIVDEVSGRRSRTWWTTELEPRLILECDQELIEVAGIVAAHAARAAEADSWLRMRVRSGRRSGSGLFTARAKALEGDEWTDYFEERRRGRNDANLGWLDRRMMLAMGEPAWWRIVHNKSRPDEGASRWEMKTRNRGEEFLLDRLLPMAECVAARPVEETRKGLVGESVNDELGHNSVASRTATGLSTPGPVDTAVAWCALWGLVIAPTIPRVGRISRSPGMWPERLHPTVAALPAFCRPVTVPRYSQVLTSRYFDLAARPPNDQEVGGAEEMARVSARAWLVEQGVHALVWFPVLKTGSASAPERQLLTGRHEAL